MSSPDFSIPGLMTPHGFPKSQASGLRILSDGSLRVPVLPYDTRYGMPVMQVVSTGTEVVEQVVFEDKIGQFIVHEDGVPVWTPPAGSVCSPARYGHLVLRQISGPLRKDRVLSSG